MKTPNVKLSRSRGFTLIELLVVISIIAILAALLFPNFPAIIIRTRMTAQMTNGVNIYKAMANYASDPNKDQFPAYEDIDDPNTLATNSNQVFGILIKSGMLDDKRILTSSNSAWCKKVANTEATAKTVQPGENDWCYVTGLRWSTKDSRWPLLANAFSPGTTQYVTDVGQKGGAWKGTRAVVIWAGGNGEVVDTKEQGSNYFVRRPDKPQADAFKQDGAWLSGENVKVLYPAE